MRSLLIVPILSFFVVAGAAVDAGPLKVGSPAPSLAIASWVKGEPVDLSKAEEEDVYVVEFWATWCPPCRTSILHLSELQDHFKKRSVTFIGISNEKPGVVKKFLANGWDEKMRYRVAIDKENKTNNDWMRAAGQSGIPTAFVVKGGKIQWIGHPMGGLDVKVAELCGDKEFAERAKKLNDLQEALGAAFKAEKWKEAISGIDKILALQHDDQMMLHKYYILAARVKDAPAATKWGYELVERCKDAQILNQFAWIMLTEEDFAEARDLKLAKAGARKAVKLTKKKDPSVLDTYARVLADSGDLSGAIDWQKKAIEVCDNPRLKSDLENTLEEYESRKKG